MSYQGQPSNIKRYIAGEAMAANTSFAVRHAVSGETSGRVYKADKDASVTHKFHVIGVARSTSAVSAGGLIDVTFEGSVALAGEVSKSFGTNSNGGGFDSDVHEVRVMNGFSGKILVGGEFTTLNGNARKNLVRFNSDGTEDTAFYDALKSTGDLSGINGGNLHAIEYDFNTQEIYIGGNWNNISGESGTRLFAKLQASGVPDTAFNANLGVGFDNYLVAAIAIDIGSKVLVGGDFQTLNGNIRGKLVRLNINGTEDTAFYTNLGTGFSNGLNPCRINMIKVQSDFKILVGGEFTTLNGNARKNLVRLNSDGTEDTAFYTNLGTGFNNLVRCMAIQMLGPNPVGIVVGGDFTDLNGNTRYRLVKLNMDGTEDTAFYTAIGTSFWADTGIPGSVVDIKMQAFLPEKILIGGSWNSTTAPQNMARLDSTGAVDYSWTGAGGPTGGPAGFGQGGTVHEIEFSDNTSDILVGGRYLKGGSTGGVASEWLLRLNENGTEILTGGGFSVTAADIGKPVYLEASGALSITPPSVPGEAVYQIGIVETVSTLEVTALGLNGIV